MRRALSVCVCRVGKLALIGMSIMCGMRAVRVACVVRVAYRVWRLVSAWVDTCGVLCVVWCGGLCCCVACGVGVRVNWAGGVCAVLVLVWVGVVLVWCWCGVGVVLAWV